MDKQKIHLLFFQYLFIQPTGDATIHVLIFASSSHKNRIVEDDSIRRIMNNF